MRATLSRSPLTDVPGVPFIVSAATNLEDEDQTPIEGIKVEVSLAPANASSLANCSAAAREAVARQRCTVVSGAAPVDGAGRACEIVLPCAANLLLRACALSFANGTAVKGGLGGAPPCSTTPIGRNTSAWAAAPWASQPALQLLPDRANFSMGSTAVLSFSVPRYVGATSGLLIWGNGDAARRRAITKVSPGPGRVILGPLGEECRGGCKVALVLAAGRRSDYGGGGSPSEAPPRLVARSRLFDALAPHTLSHSVQLTVVGDDRLNVTLGVTGDEGLVTKMGDKSVAVAAPLGGGTIRVAVKNAATGAPATGAEVRRDSMFWSRACGLHARARACFATPSILSSAAAHASCSPPHPPTLLITPIANSQVTVMMVDRANLDLMPYDLKVTDGCCIPLLVPLPAQL